MKAKIEFVIRPLAAQDRDAVRAFMIERWHSPFIVSRVRVRNAAELPGFAALSSDNTLLGLVTYDIRGGQCEIVTLDSRRESCGIGTGLIGAVVGEARAQGCRRVWLVTTNDNLNAVRFYQKRGMRLSALYPDAVAKSRQLKPEIPLIGDDGIPIRDELEMELRLV
jgi:ribosomal protein S18 acetylase RimI-like enzyme